MGFLKLLKRQLLYQSDSGKEEFALENEGNAAIYDVREEKAVKIDEKVSKNLEENRRYVETRFCAEKNNDVVIRDLRLRGGKSAFLLFYEGMCAGDAIDGNIIKPLLELPYFRENDDYDENTLKEALITHNQVKASESFNEIIDEINFGSCAVFVEGLSCAVCADVKGWPKRSVEKAKNEQSIYGPQEAFAEMLRGNAAQVRKFLKTERLISEKVEVGNISKTAGVLMYLEDVANESLVQEIRRRIKGIAVDYVISIEEVSMLIEENPLMITGHILATERPDRVARAISDGHVALILNGSPRALILPTNAYEMTHSASD
ncbi:MAG: spore germination protein, partial [Clostridia bacterium]|nr:spore germination protein [Clostridia bacterium]